MLAFLFCKTIKIKGGFPLPFQYNMQQIPFNIVLVEPQIPPNTGNIARLCAATGCHLILVGKLGFALSDKYLKRAGLDYWQWVSWEQQPDLASFMQSLDPQQCHFLTTKTTTAYTQMQAKEGDYFFFGKETAGLPEWLRHQYSHRCFTIPIWQPAVRSLNLATATAVVLYDALRQIQRF